MKEHEQRKKAANGQPFHKVQYTFMATNEECLKRLPQNMLYIFPAVLTHWAALHVSVARSLRPLLDKGIRPETISDWLLELHALKYTSDHIAYELLLEKKKAFHPDMNAPMFSKFDDKMKYNGGVPTGSYLSKVYKQEHERIRPQLDREVKKISLNRMSIDASYKAPKMLSQHNGKRTYEALQTITNELGQIRGQILATSDSHEQLEPALEAMKTTQVQHGKEQPSIAFTDNPSRDRAFLLGQFDSLRETQAKLNSFAAMINSNANAADLGASPPMDSAAFDTESATMKAAGGNAVNVSLGEERVQVVATGSINDKIEALQEQMAAAHPGSSCQVYAFDCEWDTTPCSKGHGRRKHGNVALLQIGYRLGRDSESQALLLQLPKRGKLPNRLVAFLKDPKASFAGVNIKNDINTLGNDFELQNLSDDVSFIDLGMFARERDVIQKANRSLADIVEIVLGYKLDKRDEIRCSKWSSLSLSSEQRLYAALDVIKPLEVYEKISILPNLAQRLDPGKAVTNLLVDIVPPHDRGCRNGATRGYRVGDLATRAAIGSIVGSKTAVNPAGVSPSHVRANEGSRLVQVTKVLAPLLRVPGHFVGGRSRNDCKQATLDDFGDTPFTVLLPLTMLKDHVDSEEVRTYQPTASTSAASTMRRTTPPSHVRSKRLDDDQASNVLDSEEDGEEEESSDFGEDLPELVRKIDDDAESGDEADLSKDACQETLKEHLDTIQEAEVAAELAEKQGKVEMLFSEFLDKPPNDIKQVFSAVLGDVFHAMNRSKVPVKHEFKKSFYIALMKAFFVWDSSRLKEVMDKLKENGFTDEELEDLLYYRPSFFNKRVEQIVLPPRQLYWRVRAVFVKFGSKVDSKTGKPLFNKRAWTKAKNLLKEILLGYYSDPPGFNFYTIELDSDGSPKTDKYGIHLIKCSRGTNDVENIHRYYHVAFQFGVGFEMGDCLLAERRHRHNVRMAETRLVDFPKLGHFNTWQIDLLQILLEKNHGVLLFPGWVNGSDFRDTDEGFVTVSLHCEMLDKALKARALQISEKIKNGYSGNMKFICKAMNIPIPFLPVDGEDEYKLFSHIMLHEIPNFNEEDMALKWMEYVDGVTVFPKLPAQLRQYHKKWERNRRVQKAAESMKSDLEVLKALNKTEVPEELLHAQESDESIAAFVDDDGDVDMGTAPSGLLHFPLARLPPPMQQPPLQARRTDTEAPLYVGLERIGDTLFPFDLPPVKRAIGERGQDRQPRKRRRCMRCIEFGGDHPFDCKGRGNQDLCEYFNDDGTNK